MNKRKDPFRTLDDPEPTQAPEPVPEPEPLPEPAGEIAPGPVGCWRSVVRRPGWVRRLVVRVVLGWIWEP